MKCGGALIGKDVVVSAMHCFDDKDFDLFKINGNFIKPDFLVTSFRYNVHSILAPLSAPFQNDQEREAKVFHPRAYKRKSEKGTPFYDLAVLKLEKPVHVRYEQLIGICGLDIVGVGLMPIMEQYEVVMMGYGYLWWNHRKDYKQPTHLQVVLTADFDITKDVFEKVKLALNCFRRPEQVCCIPIAAKMTYNARYAVL